jgi:hypothetical protein
MDVTVTFNVGDATGAPHAITVTSTIEKNKQSAEDVAKDLKTKIETQIAAIPGCPAKVRSDGRTILITVGATSVGTREEPWEGPQGDGRPYLRMISYNQVP